MPGRRPLVAFVALFAVPLPACLHVSVPLDQSAAPDNGAKAAAKTDTAQAPRLEFAVLPRVPGTVVQNKTANPPDGAALRPNGPPKPIEPAGGDAPGMLPPMQVSSSVQEPPLLAVVRAYSEGNAQRAIEIIRTLNPNPQNQDLVLALLPILARGSSADMTNDPATVAVLVDQLHSAAARLEPRAALRIEKVAFCKDAGGFGRYSPRPNNTYKPNADVQLYLEVQNLVSQPAGTEFVTGVQAVVEVRDAYGALVEQIDPNNYRNRVPVVRHDLRLTTQSPLHDFHIHYIFSAPTAPGVYTITLELRDPTGPRAVKTQPIRFDVTSP